MELQRILVAYDGRPGDDATLERAVGLARCCGGRVDVIQVVSSGPLGDDALLLEERRQALERLLDPVRARGVDADGIVRPGTPFLEIIRRAVRGGHDLVMISAEGAWGLKGLMFGTTNLRLMRKCPCPVWVNRPGQSSEGRIMAALQVDLADPGKQELDARILEAAGFLSGLQGAELDVVNVWEFEGADRGMSQSEISDSMREALVRKNEDPRREAIRALLDRVPMPGVRPVVHLLRGNAGTELALFGRDRAIDLLVMGTVSRTGIAGFVMGNTAEMVALQVDCSVLTLKPAGFVTPVAVEAEESVAGGHAESTAPSGGER